MTTNATNPLALSHKDRRALLRRFLARRFGRFISPRGQPVEPEVLDQLAHMIMTGQLSTTPDKEKS